MDGERREEALGDGHQAPPNDARQDVKAALERARQKVKPLVKKILECEDISEDVLSLRLRR